MSRTVYDKNGVTFGVFAGPAATAVGGDRRRVQLEVHGRDYGEPDRAYVELPLREAVAMLREVLDALEAVPHTDRIAERPSTGAVSR